MRYTHRDIAFDVPDGWEDRSIVAFAAKPGRPGRVATNLALTREPLPEGMSLRKYADKQLVDLGRQLRDLEVLDSGPVAVAGAEAFEVRCSWRAATGAVEQRILLIPVDQSVVSLAITGPRGRREEIDAAADQILSSLQVGGAGSPGTSRRSSSADAGPAPPPAPPVSPPQLAAAPRAASPLESSSAPWATHHVAPPPLYGLAPPPPEAPAAPTSPRKAVPVASSAPAYPKVTAKPAPKPPPAPPPKAPPRAPTSERRATVSAAPAAAEPPSSAKPESPPMPPEQRRVLEQEGVTALAALRWGCGRGEVVQEDLALYLPWVVRHTLTLCVGPERRWLVVGRGLGEPLLFDEGRNLQELNRLLRAENVTLPGGLDSESLASAITLLLSGPGGATGSPAFLEEQEPVLAQWLVPPDDEAERIFRRHCEPAALTLTEDGQWLLELSYFAARGEVERWLVMGDARRVRSVDPQVVVRKGRLRFPWAA